MQANSQETEVLTVIMRQIYRHKGIKSTLLDCQRENTMVEKERKRIHVFHVIKVVRLALMTLLETSHPRTPLEECDGLAHQHKADRARKI